MSSWKESMINRLSNLINRNRSAAKISQVLCSSDSAHENIAHNFLAKLDRNYSCGKKLIVRGEYLGKSNGADYKLVVRRRPEGTYVDWGLFNLKTKKQKLLVREGVKKNKDLFGTLSQTMGRWVQRWFQSPKLFSENNHSVIFTTNILKCPKTCNT